MGKSQKLRNVGRSHRTNPSSDLIDHGELYQLVYLSTSLLPELDRGGQEEVENILKAARCRNEKCGITGALTYNEYHFAQVLEGTRADVGDIFRSIQRDNRHTDILVVQEGGLTERDFADWSMAYVGDAGSLRIISPNLHFGTLPGRGNLTAIELIEMMKFFLLNPIRGTDTASPGASR